MTITRTLKNTIGKIVTKRKKILIERGLPSLGILLSSFGDNFVTANITDTGNNGFTDIHIFFHRF